jgi:hypothetical protein
MIFARYNGTGVGENFIPGKTYFGTPEMENADVVNMGFVNIRDEKNQNVRVIPSEERFEFFDEVYAVALEPFDEFQPGDVVTLDGGQMNGEIYISVKGQGYRKASTVAVLDRTNVYPGIVVLDVSLGLWSPVMRVDECLWMVLKSQSTLRSPPEFRFPVSHDGELMSVPMVMCIDDTGSDNLTKGKIYHLDSENGIGQVYLEDDTGKCDWFLSSRFRMG